VVGHLLQFRLVDLCEASEKRRKFFALLSRRKRKEILGLGPDLIVFAKVPLKMKKKRNPWREKTADRGRFEGGGKLRGKRRLCGLWPPFKMRRRLQSFLHNVFWLFWIGTHKNPKFFLLMGIFYIKGHPYENKLREEKIL
jgi:hypothetical protein